MSEFNWERMAHLERENSELKERVRFLELQLSKRNQEVLPARHAARFFGVTVGWLKEEADSGRIPSVKAGKTFLFNTKAVESVLAIRAGGNQDAGIEKLP